MIRLRVLGSIELTTGEGQAIHRVLTQPKRLALLVYLASGPEREFYGREELFSLFWPELSTERARAALSQALYFLRRELGEDTILARGKDEIGINREIVRCDTFELAAARRSGRHRQVLELFRGDLLQGLFLLDGTDWEEWLETERNAYRRWASEAAWALAEAAREAGEAERAVRLGERAFELSGHDEPCLQRLLILLDDLGDRAGAARLYRDHSERLRREYGIDVAPETRALYERVTSRSPRTTNRPRESEGRELARDVDGASWPAPREHGARSGSGPVRRTGALMAAALLLMAVLVLGRWSLQVPGESRVADGPAAPQELVRLTIMPFVDRDADAGMNFVAPGLREELFHRLSRLHRLRVVIPPAAPIDRKGGPAGGQWPTPNPFDFQLAGEVLASGSGLQVELQLTGEPSKGDGSWQSARFALDDMLSASANAAEWTAERLLPGLTPEDARQLRSGVTTDNEAFSLYLRGRYQLMDANVEAFRKARELFEQSLALDPAFARAWSGLADAFMGLSWARGLPDVLAVPRAREAAERSLELNPGLAEGHASLGHILNRYYWDSEGAERHYHEAIRLQPGNADAHVRYSAFLRNMGRFEQARLESEEAIALDPLAFSSHRELLILDMMQQRFDAAIRQSRQLVELYPDVPMARFFLARCLIANGDFDAALEVIEDMPVGGKQPPALTLRGYLMGRTGHLEEAARVIQALQASAERAPDMPVHFDLAVVYMGLGEHESALEALELAAVQRDYRVRLLGQEPIFQVLRGQPKFTALLQQAGLPTEPGGDPSSRL